MDEMITTSAAGEMLGVSGQTVRRMIDDGHLDAIKTPGGHFRVKKSSVVNLLQSLEQTQTAGHDIKPE